MLAAMGPRRGSLRSAIAWMLVALAYALALSWYKGAMLDAFSRRSIDGLSSRHAQVLSLFQASFYFFHEDQFLPGIERAIRETPSLSRIEVLSASGQLLFDSGTDSAARAGQGPPEPRPYRRKDVVAQLAAPAPAAGESAKPVVFTSGFQAQVLIPAGQYGILYTFDGSAIRWRILGALAGGILLAFGLAWGIGRGRAALARAVGAAIPGWRRLLGLRYKFLLTVMLVNMLTGAIVFFTLSALQTREQTLRIQKESLLFAQFSTARVISDFSNFFYFYYADKFLPGIKTIISTNENLVAVRVISRRTNSVLFDSELAGPDPSAALKPAGAPGALPAGVVQAPALSPELESELRGRDSVTREIERGSERLFSVINTYRNENQEALFHVEYLFSFHTLAKSIQAIRRQILLDLVPSMGVGFLVALLFAQLLISPIRRLVSALQRVTAGDYDVSVEERRADELGDLVTAFNAMTLELRKKKELRKYLSDSTYRQVMEAPDIPGGARLGGMRVAATVLFTDIRNFVAHCESLEAEEVTAMLNEYFSDMVDVVYKHGGEVDKFIGDALLAVFYSEGTALQAIHCALEMRERLEEFNRRRRENGKSEIEIGVGITHGEIISGPIGSKDRMDFTVIGDVVNLAARIEKLSKQGRHSRILFSGQVEEKVRGLLEYELVTREKLPGKGESVPVFELVRIRELEALVANLHGGDLVLKRRSVALLGQSRNRAALPHVLGALSDRDEEVRLQAVSAAARLALPDEPGVLEALLKRLDDEPSDKVLSNLVTAVGRVCRGEKILALVPFLDSPNERIVANTVEALGQAGLPKCVDAILPKLSSRNNRIKANAAMALFAAGHYEVIDSLKPMLMHSDALMRSSAAFALGELTHLAQKDRFVEAWRERGRGVQLFLGELQECVPMLVSLLKDPEPMVKRQAIIALGKIKDKSAVLPLIDNIELAKDSKELVRDIAQALSSIGSHKLVREVISKLT